MLIIVQPDALTINIDELDTILIIVIEFSVRLLYTKIIDVVLCIYQQLVSQYHIE